MQDVSNYQTIIDSGLISKELLSRIIHLKDKVLFNPFEIRLIKELSTDEMGLEQNLENLLKKKFVHVIAAFGFIEKILNKNAVDLDNISDDSIVCLMLFELVQVDIADTLAEIDMLRDREAQLKFFEALLFNFLKDKKEDKLDYFDKDKFTGSLGNKFAAWTTYLDELSSTFNSIFSKYTSEQLNKVLIRRVREYYTAICYDHVRTSQEKKELRGQILSSTFKYHETKWKAAPKELKDDSTSADLWMNFFGDSISFLLIVFFITHLKTVSEEDLISIIKSFRWVGVFNVYIDDIIDASEDLENHDSSLYLEVISGKYNELTVKSFGDSNSQKFIFFLIKCIEKDFEREGRVLKTVEFKKLYDRFRLVVPLMLGYYIEMGKQVQLNLVNKSKELEAGIHDMEFVFKYLYNK